MDREKTVGADIQVLLQAMRGMTFERMLYQEKPTDRKNRMRALAPGMQTRRYPFSPGRPAGRPGLNVGGNPRTTPPHPSWNSVSNGCRSVWSRVVAGRPLKLMKNRSFLPPPLA